MASNTPPSRTTKKDYTSPKNEEKKANQAESIQENSGDIIDPEILDSLPPEMKRQVMMSMSMSQIKPYNPIAEKINEDHITQILNLSEKSEINEDKQITRNRWFSLIYVIIGIALFIWLIVYLVDTHENILKDLISAIILFGAGFGGGYGVKSYHTSKKDS